MLFKYMCKFRTSSEKFEIRTIQISWKIYKILKTVEFFNMWLFISEIKNLNFCICQNTHFCCSGLGQVSSWWINSIFRVGKVSIWRCLLMLTFSRLLFLFNKYPMNFPVDYKWSKRITVHCVLLEIDYWSIDFVRSHFIMIAPLVSWPYPVIKIRGNLQYWNWSTGQLTRGSFIM